MSRQHPDRHQAVLQSYLDELLTSSEEPEPHRYADPLEEQRERLQKLLYSASLRESTAEPIPAPVVVEPEVKTRTRTDVQSFAPEVTRREVREEHTAIEVVTRAEPEPKQEPEYEEPEALLEEPEAELPEPEAMAFRAKDLDWLDNGRPAWAQKRFEVLLFKVSGLTLAVPLIALGQIHPMTDELTPLFGQADWFMGLLPTPMGKIRTVNTARFVMPERYDENFVRTAQYVISIDGVPWGLAVDTVNQPISLDPDDVKWRSERSRRPWLAGTVKEHMCALLDIPRVGQLLMEADTRRRA